MMEIARSHRLRDDEISMSDQNDDQVTALIENSKQLIAQLNQLLETADAPIRFAETPASDVTPDSKDQA
jgi:hypothetical protein